MLTNPLEECQPLRTLRLSTTIVYAAPFPAWAKTTLSPHSKPLGDSNRCRALMTSPMSTWQCHQKPGGHSSESSSGLYSDSSHREACCGETKWSSPKQERVQHRQW